jgi:hypothetical protein
MICRFEKPSVSLRAPVLAFASVMVGFGSIDLQASDGFANSSYFYTNNLTNQISVRQDFDRLGGGFGLFEVNSQTGLELLSEAPNSYQGVRVLRATLSTARSWQVVVKAHVQLAEDPTEEHRDARAQLQSHYGAYLGIVKLARNSEGTPSIVESAPNRASVVLRKSDGGGWQHYFAFGRYSGGVKVGEETINPLGNQPEALLRLRFSAADRSLIVGYSIDNGQEFSELPSVDLGTEWGLTPDDELVVTLEGNSSPYSIEDRDNDFWSTFDRDASITPAPLPVYSVRSGEIFFSDLGIAYEPSQIAEFTYEAVNGSEVVVTGYTGSEAHVSVPQFINGLPVTKIGPNAFSDNPNLLSVVLPISTTEVSAGSFANSPNLVSVYLPLAVHTIGDGAFSGSISLRTVQLPSNLVLQAERFGLGGGLAFQELVQRVGASLAENELFMAALVTNETFLGALSAKILSRYGSYGLAARSDLSQFATRQDVQNGLEQSRAQGINSVIADPNSWNLFTADQISGLSIGDLTLTRQVNGSFVLNYNIEQSNDLVNWTTYRNYGEELTGLPTNKKFIRIRVKQ